MAYLFRYREFALQSNAGYLIALAEVDDPTPALRGLDANDAPNARHPARRVRAFNPAARADGQLFAALMSAEHALHGFTKAISAPGLQPPRFRSTTMPDTRVPGRVGSSTVFTCTGWSRRFPGSMDEDQGTRDADASTSSVSRMSHEMGIDRCCGGDGEEAEDQQAAKK